MPDATAPYAAMMTHPVADADRWKETWDRHESDRRDIGVLGHHINLAEDDQGLVTVFMPLGNIDQVRAFVASPDRVDEMARAGISMAGPAIALYHSPPGDVIDLEVGFPVDGTVDPTQGVEPSELPGGRTAQLVHEGAYDDLGSSWERLDAWLREQGLTPGAAAWEVYLTEPRPDMDPAELRTELNWSLA